MTRKRLRNRVEMTDKEHITRVDAAMRLLRDNPDFALIQRRRFDSALSTIANVYSWYVHNPDLAESIEEETGVKGERKIRALSRTSKNRIAGAWSFLRGIAHYSERPTEYFLTTGTIKQVASLVDPRNEDFRSFDKEARIFHPDYQSPGGFEVPDRMSRLMARLKNSRAHPIDKALHMHAEVIAIQPFEVGNKRIAKLLQHSILHDYGHLPIQIFPKEKQEYCAHLREALVQGPASEGRKGFYNYMAGKHAASLASLNGHNGNGRH